MAVRKQKSPICKNCSYVFAENQPDEFCPQCGQENNERIVSFGRFLKDSINMYLVLDSKLLVTIGTVLFMPGKLSLAFSEGKIARYLVPFRLYFIISLVYFSFFSAKLLSLVENSEPISAINNLDVPVINNDGIEINLKDSILNEVKVTQSGSINFLDDKISIDRVIALADKYDTKTTMDSLKKEYPYFNENPFATTITTQLVKLYKSRGKDFLHYFIGALPFMMILLMPLLALFFKLLYIRRNRFFVEHLTFFIHLHSFLYLLLSIYMLIWGFNAKWMFGPILLSAVYLSLAMKKMYGQGWGKTLFKQGIFMFFFYPLFLFFYLLATLAVSFMLF
ncbi:MAG: DUF3667 domain-containing protein [Sphingobacteriales bacterium]|nr:MAG: DUF3667 domain-containing protein [Sphingobacteriales bacterium]